MAIILPKTKENYFSKMLLVKTYKPINELTVIKILRLMSQEKNKT